MLSCNFFRRYPAPGESAAARSSSAPTRSPANCGRWHPVCPAAARRWIRRCATTPSPRCCATRTPRTAGSAAHRNSRRRRCSRRCCGTGSAPAHRRRWPRSARTGDRDGPRRHVRPAGRRLRPLQRRQRLGGTAFREDAVRQRVAVACLCALGPADRRPAGAPGHRRDRAVPARRSARRRHVHLVAGRRRRRPRGFDLCLDACAADRGARRRRRALGRFGFRRDRGRHLRSRRLGAATARRSRRPGSPRARPDRAAGRPADPAATGPRRQGRHRLERAGDHRAGRSQCGAGRTRISRRRNRLRDGAAGTASGGWPVAPGQPGRPGRGERRDPGRPRDAGHRPARAVPADRRGRPG